MTTATFNREELQDAYINHTIESLNPQELKEFAYVMMEADLSDFDDAYLLWEVKECAPELLACAS
jgi:hypothetical protein